MLTTDFYLIQEFLSLTTPITENKIISVKSGASNDIKKVECLIIWCYPVQEVFSCFKT